MPNIRVRSVTDISPSELRRRGIAGMILDVDNTITGWRSAEVRPELRAWISAVQELMPICFLSNTAAGRRINRISEALGIPHVWPARKPFRYAFMRAAKVLGTCPEETAVVGDQLFTDIAGGNRAGMFTVLVAPLGTSEFIGTKIMRIAERGARWVLRRRGMIDEHGAPVSQEAGASNTSGGGAAA